MEKKELAIVAIQFSSIINDFNANLLKMEKLLVNGLEKYSADVVVLPEVWTCGWDCSVFTSNAEFVNDSKAIEMLKYIAIKYNVNILGGSIILKGNDGLYKNACPILNKKGELIAVYEKNHLFSYYGCDEGKYITSGKNPVIVNFNGIRIGISICYDIRFPELYRAYRKTGADVLINMAAWGASKQIAWDTMTVSRAIENQCYFIALTQSGLLNDGTKNLGHSMIIDYKGDILSEIKTGEGAIFSKLNFEEMYKFRNKCTILKDIKEIYEVLVK